MSIRIPIAVVGIIIGFFMALPTGRAEALSAQWSSGLPNLCAVGSNSCPSGSGWFSMFSVQGSVTYNAQVVDSATGAVIACGSTVPAGTTVRYEFIPHVYQDISWFATGRGFDSPYGDWVANGGAPAGSPCIGKNAMGTTGGGAGYGNAYGSLSVNPPEKSVTGVTGVCTTAADGVSKECSLTEAGEVPGVFNYAPTFAYMYSALYPTGGKKLEAQYRNRCLGWSIMGTNASAPYRVEIPAKTISCPITVTPSDNTSQPPAAPNVVASAGACVTDQAHAITMTATDPDGDSVRYLIDWDGDDAVDQFAPSSGYVPSGTAQTASRIHTNAGAKSVRVRAQDQGGRLSSWATLNFNCASAGTSGDTSGIDSSTSGISGTGGGGAPQAPSIDMSLRVIPSLVQRGATSRVHWSTTNLVSCIVSSPNGDTWNALVSAVGGERSKPITARTEYTLRCVDGNGNVHTRRAIVGIVPNWRER